MTLMMGHRHHSFFLLNINSLEFHGDLSKNLQMIHDNINLTKLYILKMSLGKVISHTGAVVIDWSLVTLQKFPLCIFRHIHKYINDDIYLATFIQL